MTIQTRPGRKLPPRLVLPYCVKRQSLLRMLLDRPVRSNPEPEPKLPHELSSGRIDIPRGGKDHSCIMRLIHWLRGGSTAYVPLLLMHDAFERDL